VLPKNFDGESTAAAIRMRDGKVYISNRGHNSVSEVEFENEKLSLIKTIDCGGSSPRDFDFVDKFMICTNENSDNVTVFDCENGFNETCDISLPSPLNVVYL
jgi:6-phosphogluconolactonase